MRDNLKNDYWIPKRQKTNLRFFRDFKIYLKEDFYWSKLITDKTLFQYWFGISLIFLLKLQRTNRELVVQMVAWAHMAQSNYKSNCFIKNLLAKLVWQVTNFTEIKTQIFIEILSVYILSVWLSWRSSSSLYKVDYVLYGVVLQMR